MKINRNDECWCNSGLKYKKCHMEFDEKLKSLKERGFEVPSHN
ncbi:MAG: SEC-C metal-binding domain-containing protein, partial [Romboutsia timonensis]